MEKVCCLGMFSCSMTASVQYANVFNFEKEKDHFIPTGCIDICMRIDLYFMRIDL